MRALWLIGDLACTEVKQKILQVFLSFSLSFWNAEKLLQARPTLPPSPTGARKKRRKENYNKSSTTLINCYHV